jgi:hypothetical protein
LAEDAHRRARAASERYAQLAADYETHVRWQSERVAMSLEPLEELRHRVREYAALLRLLETTPERALVCVKEAVFADQRLRSGALHPLHESVVRWFVESFYAA